MPPHGFWGLGWDEIASIITIGASMLGGLLYVIRVALRPTNQSLDQLNDTIKQERSINDQQDRILDNHETRIIRLEDFRNYHEKRKDD